MGKDSKKDIEKDYKKDNEKDSKKNIEKDIEKDSKMDIEKDNKMDIEKDNKKDNEKDSKMNKKKINILVANPSGNITIFVKDAFDRKDYAKVADQLLDMKDLRGEQVAYICENDAPQIHGKMEMCGLEFCGNASRSFALMRAIESGLKGNQIIRVEVSGVDEILDVEVNTDNNYTKVRMPRPKRIFDEEILGRTFRIVDFGGIMHVIVDKTQLKTQQFVHEPLANPKPQPHQDLRSQLQPQYPQNTYDDFEPTLQNFDKFKQHINEKFNPPAMGVMFWDADTNSMIPVVYVKDVDSTYFEGSCGSGTTALSCAIASKLGDGEHKFVVKQPAGTIISTAIVKSGEIESVTIEGTVELSETMQVEIEL